MLRFNRVLVPVVIVLAAAGVTLVLASMRESPSRQERPYSGPLVNAQTVRLQDHQVSVQGNGTVQARVGVQLVPQVGGRVAQVHPGLVPGGYFEAGEALIVIDPADYELAVKRAEAAVTRVEVELQTRQAEAEVAEREWERLHPGEEPPSPLVLRLPQVEQARAELASAEADLATARLDLERTRLTLPFAGRVLSESVDAGQFVVAGQALASVYGTEAMEVPVPLEDAELAWFHVPGAASRHPGAAAVLRADFAGVEQTWHGEVVRTEGQVDPATRMVQVVVAVRNPVSDSPRPVALVPGMFVGVKINGDTLAGVAAVPRHAVHGGGTVWVVEDGTLRFQKVTVAHEEEELAFVADGLEEGDQVVTSQLDVVTDGMRVRLAPEQEARESAGQRS